MPGCIEEVFCMQNTEGVVTKQVYRKYCRNITRRFAFFLVFILLIQIIAGSVNARPIFFFHHITMVQGDDPSTEEIESESEISVFESIGVYIPWNESVVEVALPFGAKSWDIDHVTYPPMDDFPGEYSAFFNPENPPFTQFIDMSSMSCCYAHRLAWGFPEGADRNTTESIYIGTETDFIQHFNDTRSDPVWNFSVSGLKLEPGNTTGDYFSVPLSVPLSMGVNITKIVMSWNITIHKENVSISVSNNNGTDWMDMNGQNGQVVNFSTQGNELIWRINMTQDINQNNTPILDELQVNVTYIPFITPIFLNLEYKLQRDPDTNRFEFTFDLYDDYIYNVPLHILIYINDDHILESKNISMAFTEVLENLPDKNRYSFVTGSYLPIVEISVHKIEEEEDFPWIILLALLLIVILIAMLLISRARSKESEEPSEAEGEEPLDSGEELEELEKKKEGLLKAIKKLDKDFEEGLIDEDVYNELRTSYKSKAASVMKQIDALAVSALAVTKAPEISIEKAALMKKKEKILKSIKKIDSDYEEGLLDEDVYQDLRKSYKEKAVEVLKEIEDE
jgi:hypothetical protein